MRAFFKALMAIVLRWFAPRRAQGLQGRLTQAIKVLDEAIVNARESH